MSSRNEIKSLNRNIKIAQKKSLVCNIVHIFQCVFHVKLLGNRVYSANIDSYVQINTPHKGIVLLCCVFLNFTIKK